MSYKSLCKNVVQICVSLYKAMACFYKSLCTNRLLCPHPLSRMGTALRGYRNNPGTQISKISTCQREPLEILKISTRDKDLYWYQHVSISSQTLRYYALIKFIQMYQYWRKKYPLQSCKYFKIFLECKFDISLCLPLLCIRVVPNLDWGQLRFIQQRRLCSLFLLTHPRPCCAPATTLRP